MFPTSLLLAAVVCALVVFVAAVVFRRKRVLPGPDPIVALGNVHQIDVDRFHLILEEWAEKYGELYEFWTFGLRRVVVTDIELTKKIYFARPDNFTRPGNLTDAFNQMQTVGLFALEGETWKRHRRLMSPAFSKAAVNRMHHCINTPVERMINKWQNLLTQSKTGYAIMDNPRVEMSRLTLDVVTYLSCGFDLNAVETETELTNQLAEFFNQINELAVPSISRKLRHLVPGWDSKFRAAQASTVKVVKEMIQQTRQELADEEAGRIDSGRSNLLKEMIRASRDDDSLSDPELIEEVLTIMLAGLDTTSILLSWSIYLLTQHPEYLLKIRQEAIEVLGETALPTPEQIPKLKLTNHFLQETLRVKGPAPFNGASNIEPFEYNGIHFPARTQFFLLDRIMANKGVPDAKTFRPERWEDSSMTGDLTSSFQATLPFGGGTRVCPGRQLAMIEATEALATLVRSFDFELDGEHPHEVTNFVMMSSPYRVKVKAAASL